jgi:hypothetical protein
MGYLGVCVIKHYDNSDQVCAFAGYVVTKLWNLSLSKCALWYTRCNKKYGECINKKNYYSKIHIATNNPQNTPSRFEHIYPIVLATFWSSSGTPYSWVSLVALSWLPRCPVSFLNVYLSCHFDFGEELVARCQIRWIRWIRKHRKIFIWQKYIPYVMRNVHCDIYRM